MSSSEGPEQTHKDPPGYDVAAETTTSTTIRGGRIDQGHDRTATGDGDRPVVRNHQEGDATPRELSNDDVAASAATTNLAAVAAADDELQGQSQQQPSLPESVPPGQEPNTSNTAPAVHQISSTGQDEVVVVSEEDDSFLEGGSDDRSDLAEGVSLAMAQQPESQQQGSSSSGEGALRRNSGSEAPFEGTGGVQVSSGNRSSPEPRTENRQQQQQWQPLSSSPSAAMIPPDKERRIVQQIQERYKLPPGSRINLVMQQGKIQAQVHFPGQRRAVAAAATTGATDNNVDENEESVAAASGERMPLAAPHQQQSQELHFASDSLLGTVARSTNEAVAPETTNLPLTAGQEPEQSMSTAHTSMEQEASVVEFSSSDDESSNTQGVNNIFMEEQHPLGSTEGGEAGASLQQEENGTDIEIEATSAGGEEPTTRGANNAGNDSGPDNRNDENGQNSTVMIPPHVRQRILQQVQSRYQLPPGTQVRMSMNRQGAVEVHIYQRPGDGSSSQQQQQQQERARTVGNEESSNSSSENDLNADASESASSFDISLGSSSAATNRSLDAVGIVSQLLAHAWNQDSERDSGPPSNTANDAEPGRRQQEVRGELSAGTNDQRPESRMRQEPSNGPSRTPIATVRLRVGANGGSRPSSTARLPPLNPTNLPDNQQSLRNQDGRDELDRFRCNICFEYLRIPSSCGQCTSRFCFPCMTKALATSRGSNNNNTNRNTTTTTNSRCPACRSSVRAPQIDRELAQEMESHEEIPCRFEGCSKMVRMTNVEHHEHFHCPGVRVSCRYQPFGCGWKGLRRDLAQHEADDCALAKVSGLVNEHRALRELFQQNSNELNARIGGLNRMLELQRELSQTQQLRSVSNPLDVVSFVLGILCSAQGLVRTRETWREFYLAAEGRGAVFNLVALSPTFLLIFRLMFVEYIHSISILRSRTFTFSGLNENEKGLILLENAISFLALALVVILVLVCFHVDNRSSTSWQSYKIPRIGSEGRLLLHVCTLAIFLMYSLVFEILGGFFTTVSLFVTLTGATALLATATAAFSSEMARIRSMRDQISLLHGVGRSGPPLLFGLRYAFVSYLAGLGPCVGAMCFLRMVEPRLKLIQYSLLGQKELVFSDASHSVYYDMYFVLRLAHEALRAKKDFFVYCGWLAAATSLLLVANLITSCLGKLGEIVGRQIFQEAQQMVARSNNNRNTRNPSTAAGKGTSTAGLALLALSACLVTILVTF